MVTPDSGKKVPGDGWRDVRNRYRRGDTVRVISGTFEGLWGTVDSVVCQKSHDYPEKVSPGYHIQLKDGKWVSLRRDQVVSVWICPASLVPLGGVGRSEVR